MDTPISGKMMKAIRGRKRLSQQQLADRSGVGVATIKRIERADGEYGCRSTSAVRLASAMGVKIEDLSEDTFKRVFDIGGDIELHIDQNTDPDEFRQESEYIAQLLERRRRLLES